MMKHPVCMAPISVCPKSLSISRAQPLSSSWPISHSGIITTGWTWEWMGFTYRLGLQWPKENFLISLLQHKEMNVLVLLYCMGSLYCFIQSGWLTSHTNTCFFYKTTKKYSSYKCKDYKCSIWARSYRKERRKEENKGQKKGWEEWG